MRRSLDKAILWIAAAGAAVALATTLSGCELPPVCAQIDVPPRDDCVVLNHPPTVRLRVDYGIYTAPVVGHIVWFDAYGSDPDRDRLHYEWDRDGDGRFETARDEQTDFSDHALRRVFQTPGNKRVSVRVTDYPTNVGGEGSASATVDVRVFTRDEIRGQNRPDASFTVSAFGLTVRLDASASSDEDGDRIVRYQWHFDGNRFADLDLGDPVAGWTFRRAGEHSIGLVVYDELGLRSDRLTQRITVSGPCTPPACPGSTQGARASGANGLPFSARLKGKTLKAKLLHLPGQASWAERTLRRFLTAPLRAKLSKSAEAGTMSGIGLASGRRGSKACVRVSVTIPSSGLPTGRFEVIGGTGVARRLRATATFRFAGGPDGSALAVGTMQAARGKARPLSGACRRLGRVRSGH